MRQIASILGSIVGIGIFLLRYANKGANSFQFISLPDDLKTALIAMSQIPTLLAWMALIIGLGCLAYLIHDSFAPARSKMWADQIGRWFGRISTISLSKHATQMSLSDGLYVGEMLMSIDKLQSDRHSEIAIRLFNGTGRVVAIEALSGLIGEIRLDDRWTLPPPTISPSTNKLLFPFRELLIYLSQRVPPNDADKILQMIEEGRQVLLYFDRLTINVREHEKQTALERLKLWDGMTIKRGINYGRLVSFSAGSGVAVGFRGS